MNLDPIEPTREYRLYASGPEKWTAHIKPTSEKEYCYSKTPGDEHFHMLMTGELYLENNGEKYCLNCAFRHGAVSEDRMHWKRGD